MKHEVSCTEPAVFAQLEMPVARRGVDGFRLRDLAQAVGGTEAALRARYGGLASLQGAFARRLTGMLALQFCEAAPVGESVRVSLRSYIARWVDFGAEHPAYVRLCLHEIERSSLSRGPLRMGEGPLALLRLRLSELIRAGRRQEEFRKGSAENLFRLRNAVLLVELAAGQRKRRGKRISRSTREAITQLRYEMEWGFLATKPRRCNARDLLAASGAQGAQRIARLQGSTRCLGQRVLQ